MLNILISSKKESLNSLLFTKIKEDLEAKKQVVLVVPAQANLATEKRAFLMLEKSGFFDLHIVRGQKLSEIIQSETRRPPKTAVTTSGRLMLLRSIASKNKDSLTSFSSIAADPSFIELVSDFVIQMKQNGLGEQELLDITQKAQSPILKDKLSDMSILFKEYEKLMAGKFTDSEDMVKFTADMAKMSPFIQNSAIYYYGFYSFTKTELLLLEQLEKASLGLNIALLTGDEPFFAASNKTLKKLTQSFKETKIIGESSKTSLVNLPKEKVHIAACANPYSQALTIAADIKRKVREDGLSYSDICVLSSGDEQMSGSIKRVFKEAQIPFFADEKRTLLYSSAIEAVTSSLKLASEGYKTYHALRFIKSGVCDFEDDDVERFENYVKLYHIKDNKFKNSFKYGKESLGEEVFEKLEQMRKKFYLKTSSFVQNFSDSETVKEKSIVLYKYLLDELNLSARLDELAIKQEEMGLLDACEESKQIFDELLDVLDQMVELLGNEKLSNSEYEELFSTSLADIKVGVLPQSEGKVCLGTIQRSMTEEVKALYVAGINDQIIPSKNDPTYILTPKELSDIEKLGYTISKNSESLSEDEMFSIYTALSAASDYLFLSYCNTAADGSELKPSTLIMDIQNLFGDIKVQGDIFNSGNELMFIEGKTLALQRLSQVLREGMEGKAVPTVWKQTYNLLKDEAGEIKEGLRYKNIKRPLGKEIASKLYQGQGDFKLSPSRLDNYASCPFRYFVGYGLRPLEEKEFAMNAAEIGSIHHEALLKLCSMLSAPAIEGGFNITDERSLWMSVSEQQLSCMLDEILLGLKEEFLGGVMTASKESEYTSKRTKLTCLRFAKHMVEEVRHSVIEKMYFETRFGENALFPAIAIQTSAGKVVIEGRIDRVDVCPKDGENKYIRVIDYKSGVTKFSKDLIAEGLNLQLMVYLESALENYPKESSGGIYYYHIKDADATANLEDFPKEELAEDVLKQIQKAYRLDGMDVDEQFKKDFSEKLFELCSKLTSGNIDVQPKKYKSLFDSCTYCKYKSICQKEIK